MRKLKFEKQVSTHLEVEKFIDEIKENNPEIIITRIERYRKVPLFFSYFTISLNNDILKLI